MRMPLFCWGIIATSSLVIVGTPVLAGALFLLILDRLAMTNFFRAAGDPLL